MTMRNIIPIVLVLAFAGCTESRHAQKAKEEEGFTTQIVKYEASFRPSDYDLDPGRQPRTSVELPPGDVTVPADTVSVPMTEVVQGFRVQLFASNDIDESRQKKADAQALFPGEWFYIEYDPPAYKVRAGNFLTRFEAEKFVKQLDEKGFSGAWTVPARVFNNPPPPPAPER